MTTFRDFLRTVTGDLLASDILSDPMWPADDQAYEVCARYLAWRHADSDVRQSFDRLWVAGGREVVQDPRDVEPPELPAEEPTTLEDKQALLQRFTNDVLWYQRERGLLVAARERSELRRDFVIITKLDFEGRKIAAIPFIVSPYSGQNWPRITIRNTSLFMEDLAEAVPLNVLMHFSHNSSSIEQPRDLATMELTCLWRELPSFAWWMCARLRNEPRPTPCELEAATLGCQEEDNLMFGYAWTRDALAHYQATRSLMSEQRHNLLDEAPIVGRFESSETVS